jgi:hypothetical protein
MNFCFSLVSFEYNIYTENLGKYIGFRQGKDNQLFSEKNPLESICGNICSCYINPWIYIKPKNIQHELWNTDDHHYHLFCLYLFFQEKTEKAVDEVHRVLTVAIIVVLLIHIADVGGLVGY